MRRFLLVVGFALAAAIGQPSAAWQPALTRLQEITNADAQALSTPVLSPDGAFAYVVGTAGAVHVFALAPDSITWVQTNYEAAADLLSRPVLAMSPDGASLYATSYGQLVAFSRDPSTGILTWVATHRDDTYGINGLEAPSDVAVSPDGAHVYVTAAFDSGGGTLALFDRNPSTSALDFKAIWREDVGGIQGLDLVTSLALSPDGRHLYTLGWDQHYFPFTCVATLLVFERDAGTGLLDLVQTDTEDSCFYELDTGEMVISPDGKNIYAERFSDDLSGFNLIGRVIWWARDAATGTVTKLDSFRRDDVNSLAMAPDGSRLYTGFDLCGPDCSGAFGAWLRDPDTGALSPGGGTLHAVDETSQGVAAHPDGARVVVAGYARPDLQASIAQAEYLDGIGFYDVTSVGVPLPDRMDAPRSVVASPDGRNVYVGSNDTILDFERDAESSLLRFADAWPASPPSADLDDVRGLALSPDGAQLYATGLASNSVAVFTRDPDSGSLTLLQALHDGAGGVDGLYGARGIAVSADGKFVYVAGISDGAVALFSRAPLTGELSFVTAYRNGIDGIEGLDGATNLAFGPGDAQIYVASQVDDAVVVFARDAESGALTFVEAERDGVDGVNGLANAVDVAVSPDGANVYAAGLNDSGLAGFQRDPSTGALSFQSFTWSGRLPRYIELTPDGTRVFVTTQVDEISIFDRDPATGTLSFREVECATRICSYNTFASAMNADGSILYVVSLGAHALTAFATVPEPGAALVSLVALVAVVSLRTRQRFRSARRAALRR